MAYWNLHERAIEGNNEIVKNDIRYPLVFFHFSGYDPLKPDILSKYQDRFSFSGRKDIIELFKDYAQKLIGNNYDDYIGYPSYYDVEKRKQDLADLLAFKKSFPMYKRIIRGIILRLIKWFNVNTIYYTQP